MLTPTKLNYDSVQYASTAPGGYLAASIDSVGVDTSPVDATLFNKILADLDHANSMLNYLLAEQSGQLSRVFGPKPEVANGQSKPKENSSGGSAQAVLSLLDTVRDKLGTALNNQCQLAKVG